MDYKQRLTLENIHFHEFDTLEHCSFVLFFFVVVFFERYKIWRFCSIDTYTLKKINTVGIYKYMHRNNCSVLKIYNDFQNALFLNKVTGMFKKLTCKNHGDITPM
jgi:hypothetical protein